VDDQLKPGDHACLLHDTMDDQLSAVTRFAGSRLGDHQQVAGLAEPEIDVVAP
jgi:hypothetical protein